MEHIDDLVKALGHLEHTITALRHIVLLPDALLLVLNGLLLVLPGPCLRTAVVSSGGVPVMYYFYDYVVKWTLVFVLC